VAHSGTIKDEVCKKIHSKDYLPPHHDTGYVLANTGLGLFIHHAMLVIGIINIPPGIMPLRKMGVSSRGIGEVCG